MMFPLGLQPVRSVPLRNNSAGSRADWDCDGDFDAADTTAFVADHAADADLGRGAPSYDYARAGGAVRKLYAGYEHDPALAKETYHVRHRVLLAELGRWTRRDPLGYVDGASLYRYARSSPVLFMDPSGLYVPGTHPTPPDCPVAGPGDIVGHSTNCGGGPFPFGGPDATCGGDPGGPVAPDYDPCDGCPPGTVSVPKPGVPPGVSNGCGGSPIDGLILDIALFERMFKPCCDAHDLCYIGCGTDRAACDAIFCGCMMGRCGALFHDRPIALAACMAYATAGCGAVTAGGGYFHCAAQRKHCHCVQAFGVLASGGLTER